MNSDNGERPNFDADPNVREEHDQTLEEFGAMRGKPHDRTTQLPEPDPELIWQEGRPITKEKRKNEILPDDPGDFVSLDEIDESIHDLKNEVNTLTTLEIKHFVKGLAGLSLAGGVALYEWVELFSDIINVHVLGSENNVNSLPLNQVPLVFAAIVAGFGLILFKRSEGVIVSDKKKLLNDQLEKLVSKRKMLFGNQSLPSILNITKSKRKFTEWDDGEKPKNDEIPDEDASTEITLEELLSDQPKTNINQR